MSMELLTLTLCKVLYDTLYSTVLNDELHCHVLNKYCNVKYIKMFMR